MTTAATAPSVEITYGHWERDYDGPPIYEGRIDRTGHVALTPRAPLRRRRFETWHDEQGRRMGRWTWEYASSP